MIDVVVSAVAIAGARPTIAIPIDRGAHCTAATAERGFLH
jgi:hypothetical protein